MCIRTPEINGHQSSCSTCCSGQHQRNTKFRITGPLWKQSIGDRKDSPHEGTVIWKTVTYCDVIMVIWVMARRNTDRLRGKGSYGLIPTCWIQDNHMMTSSNGNIFRVTGPLCGEFTGPGEFPTQRPVTRSFDVFLDLRPNKRLSKQWRGWWFETLSRPFWRHRNQHLDFPNIFSQVLHRRGYAEHTHSRKRLQKESLY